MSPSASTSNLKTRAWGLGRQLWASYGQARWQGLSASARLWVLVFIGFMGVWVFVSIAILPAMRTLNASERQREEVAQQVVQMRSLQQRAQELQKIKSLSREESLKSLESITPAGNPALQMTIQGDRVLVQLKNLPASQLAAWMAQARSNAQTLPDEVHITRAALPNAGVQAGVNTTGNSAKPSNAWDGQIILRLPKKP